MTTTEGDATEGDATAGDATEGDATEGAAGAAGATGTETGDSLSPGRDDGSHDELEPVGTSSDKESILCPSGSPHLVIRV